MPKLALFGRTHLELRKNRWTAYLGPTASSEFSPQSTVLDIDKIKQRQDLLEEAVMQVWLEAKRSRPPAGKTSIMTEDKVSEVKTKGAAVNKALDKPDKPPSSSMISGCRCFCNKELTEICNHIAVTPFLEPAGESRKDARQDGSIAFPSPPSLPESERSSTEENQMEAETEESAHEHNEDLEVVQGDREGVEAEPFVEDSLDVGIMFGLDGANRGKYLPDSKEGANTTGMPAKNDVKLHGNETDLVSETIPAGITSNQINETNLATTLTGSLKQDSDQMLPDYGNSEENGSGISDGSSSVDNIASDTNSAVDTDTGDTLVIDRTTDRKPVVDNNMSSEDTTLVPIADPGLSAKIQEAGEVFLGSASINSSSSSNISMANASAAVLTEPSDITASNGSDVSLSNVTLVFPKITYRRIQAYESVRSGRSDWRFRFPDERRPFTSFGAAPLTRSRRSSGPPEGDTEWGRGGYRYGRSIINLIPMLTEEQERENAEERGFRDTLARVRQLGKTVFIVPFLYSVFLSAII
jgi:hypothetical protein